MNDTHSDISLRGSPADCESEWLLAGKTEDGKPIIPKREQACAAIWEYAREYRELRTLAPIYRNKLKPAFDAAWDFAADANPDDFGEAPFDASLRHHLSTLVDLAEYDRVERLVFKMPGLVDCIECPDFPQTPWSQLSPNAKAKVIDDSLKTGPEATPLIEDRREAAYTHGPPVRLICEIGDDARLPSFWFASLKWMTKDWHFLNLAVHVDLNANVEDAVSSFRRLFGVLREKHKVAEKPRPKGRRGADNQSLPVASDLLKQLGALRLWFLTTSPHRLAEHATRLGYTSKSGEPNERIRQIAKSVQRAAEKAREHFGTMFGVDVVPIHSRAD